MKEFRFFQYPATRSEEIKARRWLGYWIVGIFSRRHRLEIDHYRHCGEFSDML
jgi:hypothetical protein